MNMKRFYNFGTAGAAVVLAAVVAALYAVPARAEGSADQPKLVGQSGVDRMRSLMESIKGDPAGQSPSEVQRALATGMESGTAASNLDTAPKSTIDAALKQNDAWQKAAREAYVAALPPRDQAIGASVMLGDGTLPGNNGKLYFFVSRSMPMSMLRAYAVDALYTGGTLVVKGIRRGDTIKEFLDEAVSDFNSADGQILSGMEVNPNLFDMFDIKVVPAVVWTNRIGLDDVGAGCESLPAGVPAEQITLDGPNDTKVTVDRPTCAPAPSTAYYKLTGALTLPYVLDRFEDAGLSKEATAYYRTELAERSSNVHQGFIGQTTGNSIAPLTHELKLDSMPMHVLQAWKKRLDAGSVQRGPYGPAFNPGEEDDEVYRKELYNKIDHGLGLRRK